VAQGTGVGLKKVTGNPSFPVTFGHKREMEEHETLASPKIPLLLGF
jgi:hypothetical protein